MKKQLIEYVAIQSAASVVYIGQKGGKEDQHLEDCRMMEYKYEMILKDT